MTDLATSSTPRRLRRFLLSRPTAGPRPAAARAQPLRVLMVSVWFGLLTGPTELALVLAQKQLRDGTPGFFQMNRQIAWMIPLFHLLLFSALGALLGRLVSKWSRFSTRRAAFFLGFVSLLSLSLAVHSIHPIASAILACGLAYRAAPRVEASCLNSGRLVPFTFPVLAGIVMGLVGLSIGREAWTEHRVMTNLPRAAAGAPHVLFIVLDTVSAQHMSLYGYSRDTTPNLARLARKGVRFEHARSAAPWTLPSHASMFTGRWPHDLSAGYGQPLDSDVPTLAETLRDRGYATGGFIANTLYCSAETGLNRGFIHYEDHEVSASSVLHSAAFGQVFLEKIVAVAARSTRSKTVTAPARPYKDSSRIQRDALRWLANQGDRPAFLFLNLFDAHTPYLMPDGCAKHFGLSPESRADYSLLNAFWEANKRRLSPRDVALARDAYDDCIAHMDAQVGRLLKELERQGTLRNTVVVITSDHGEAFGEHQLFGHASSLYRGEVHVPLLIVAPGRVPAGVSVRQPVSLRNLPATVLDLVGQPDEAHRFPGTSLARHWDPAARNIDPVTDPVLSEVAAPAKNNPNNGRSPVFRGSMSSLIVDGKVYIRSGNSHEELYDLDADPTESENLAKRQDSGSALATARAALIEALKPERR
ncbi:Arylsulfatase A [Singulisphaera sp. GP187]|uniref:sulfatase n=1 Tax=Singulisphaera sp. GP187 TaxID=1882752 RepID=UPI000925A734|nr:sulfatase [Singulisphaera sp. GP187]SIO60852.1 Arylsulfatase A [Singulisphaera sp. GP187]